MSLLNIIKCTSKANTTFAPKRDIKYLVIHYTAGVTSRPGTARNVASWFSKPDTKASADFIVDDEEIVQYNPDIENYYCWSVGGRKYPKTKGGQFHGVAKSSNCINIEICSSNRSGRMTAPNDMSYYFTDKALKNGIKLAAYLIDKYNLELIRHFDVTGKLCPGINGWNEESGNAQLWLEFRNAVLKNKQKEKLEMVKVSYNGVKYEITGKKVNDRNYVGIREIAEKIFKKKVDWNPKTEEVIITDVKDNFNTVK